MRWGWMAAVCAAQVVSATVAFAQENGERGADVDIEDRLLPGDVALEVGAGVLGYLGGTADVGPAWTGRVILFPHRRLSYELGYTGAVNDRPTFGDETMVATFIEADARYNLLQQTEDMPVTTYAVAGVGYAGYSGDNGDGAAIQFPLGVGVERNLSRRIGLGARLTYRPALFDNLGTLTPGEDEMGGDTWALLARIGGEF